VIVLVINQDGVGSLKRESEPPVLVHPHGPVTGKFRLERGLGAGPEEALKSVMPETLDHSGVYLIAIQIVRDL
jgi:hypothetical protein